VSDSARRFLELLADRASATDALDGPWWMALQELVADGWTITRPTPTPPALRRRWSGSRINGPGG
jgi:hypothetical protein